LVLLQAWSTHLACRVDLGMEHETLRFSHILSRCTLDSHRHACKRGQHKLRWDHLQATRKLAPSARPHWTDVHPAVADLELWRVIGEERRDLVVHVANIVNGDAGLIRVAHDTGGKVQRILGQLQLRLSPRPTELDCMCSRAHLWRNGKTRQVPASKLSAARALPSV